VNARNFLHHSPLESDMRNEWYRQQSAQVSSHEGTLAGVDVRAQADGTTAEELALVARARGGDQDAFGVLVRLHQRQVYNLALRMLRDVDEASEATQDAFLAAWQGLRSFRGDARFTTWLYRITYNHCLRLLEQRRRDVSARAELAAESAREHSPQGALSAQHASDAEQRMRETVRGEIANLPTKYRIVLVLRHLQELSYEEMAEVMSMPIGTVKTQLFRARALLKERLEGLGHMKQEGLTRAVGLRAGLESGLRGVLERGRELSQRGGAE
jgi:RNA polymerase sigma-70 factor (ECF subfamily)